MGDITRIKTDAIITLITPQGDWYGGLDRAIRNVAGNLYHNQAWKVFEASGFQNGQVVVAKKVRAHTGRFENVIFVVDDLTSPLSELLYKGLMAAKEQGYNHIAIPLVHTDATSGAVENNVGEVIDQMKIALKKFRNKSRMTISIVVYNDEYEFDLLLKKMDL